MFTRGATVPNALQLYDQYTMRSPGVFPAAMTGALPHALLKAGVGALVGRYVLPYFAQAAFPDADEERLANAGTVAGAMAGFGTSIPDMYVSGLLGGRSKGSPEFSAAGALANQFDGSRDFPGRKVGADFWSDPRYPGSEDASIRMAVMRGELDPVSAALLRTADQKATAAQATGSITGALVDAGAAFIPAYAAGRIGGAVLGAMGAAPTNSNSFAMKMGLLGAAGAAIANFFKG